MSRSGRPAGVTRILVGLALLLLVALAVGRGLMLAGWRDELTATFAREHLVPSISVATGHVTIGPVALSASGGPARIQRLWVAGAPAAGRPADRAVLSWMQVRLEPHWLDGLGSRRPARLVVRDLQLNLGRPAGAFAAFDTLHRLLPPGKRFRNTTVEIVSGTLTWQSDDEGHDLADLRGRAAPGGEGGWQLVLRRTGDTGEMVELRLDGEVVQGRLLRVHVQIQGPGGSHHWLLQAPVTAARRAAAPA